MMEQIQKLGSKLEKEEQELHDNQRLTDKLGLQVTQSESERLRIAQEKDKAFSEIEKLHSLIEEMEKAIQNENTKKLEAEITIKEKQSEVETANQTTQQLQDEIASKD